MTRAVLAFALAAAAGLSPGCARTPRVASSPVPPEAAGNRPPVVHLSCDPCQAPAGGHVRITAEAADPDGDPVTYAWSCAAGEIAAAGGVADWVAPGADGAVPVAVVVTDARGGTATDVVTVTVGARSPRS